jgi:hypothetical protein
MTCPLIDFNPNGRHIMHASGCSLGYTLAVTSAVSRVETFSISALRLGNPNLDVVEEQHVAPIGCDATRGKYNDESTAPTG